MNTILTQQLFNQYCNDYYLTNKTNALNQATLATLPSTIKNVELSLNTMLNGRLYKRYNPANLQFNGVANLSSEAEQDTLYSLLTEAVLYKIQTGAFVNVSNTFGGNITGLNHFQSSNSNIIGLRNDIRDKLVALNLYKNANYTNPTVNQPPQLLNDNPLTVQQASAINSWLSTNNFTLGGSWNFGNLNIDGTPINTYVDNLINQSEGSANSVLINYLPNAQVPLITQKDISNWNTWYQNAVGSYQGLTKILQNYITNAPAGTGNPVPLIQSSDITNWNATSTTQTKILNILTNYYGTGQNVVEVPTITQVDLNKWNDTATNVASVLQNYWPNTAIPTITQADITKWNSNSGSSSGSTITTTTYTLTITNKWSINFSNYGQMELTESTAVWSPDPTQNNIIFIVKPSQTLPQTSPYIEVSAPIGVGSLISAFLYPTNGSNYDSWTNISYLSLPNDWYTNTMLEVYSSNGHFVYANWNTNVYGNASPVYIANNGLIQAQLSFNYYVDYSGSGTAPSYPTQTFTEIATFMIDVVIAK